MSAAGSFDIPQTMKAVRAHGRGLDKVSVDEIPVPEPGPGQALARVDAAGVCTSIIKLLAQGPDHAYLHGWDPAQWPLTLGDEGSVTLVKVGDALADRYTPGQRFAIQPAVDTPPILHRERYRDQAQGMKKCAVGYTLPGHLAQYILIQEEVFAADCLLPLPDPEMPFFAVSMGEPISCIYSAQERNIHLLKDGPFAARRAHLGLLPGGVSVVVGAGAMGRMHAEMALRFKPRCLVVSDLQSERLERTRACLGAKAAANGVELLTVTPDRLHETVGRFSNGQGADDVILAVGIRPVQQDAIKLLAKGGVANLFGGLPKGQHILELDALDVHYREIKLVGSSGGEPSDMAATLEAIARQDIDPGNYVAAVGSLDCAPEILRLIEKTEIDGKAILYPHVPSMPLRRVERWTGDDEQAFLQKGAVSA